METKWVDIKDGRPEGIVLVHLVNGEIQTAKYLPTVCVIGGCFDFDKSPVTHWALLPKPPTL
jgi:hypothetical protein